MRDLYKFILYPFLIVFGTGIFIHVIPIHFIPDYLNISTFNNIYELFILIVGSLVSLIGIYVSVTIVAYQFFKQRTGVDFQKSFLINPVSAYYISFSVLTILFSFISSIYITSSDLSNPTLSLVYYNIFLFSTIILGLIPASFNMFSSLKPDKLANRELFNINSETIFIKASSNIDEQGKILEQDSFLKLENIIITLIQVNEQVKAITIIQKVSRHIFNIAISQKNKFDREYVVDRIISFLMRMVDSSLILKNNSVLLSGIWKTAEQLYQALTERELNSTTIKRFRETFFERYFSRLLKTNHDEMIFYGISSLTLIIKQQILYNMPSEDSIYSLNHLRKSIDKNFKSHNRDYDFEISEHWTEISNRHFEIYSFVINRGISFKMPEIINKCFEELASLNFSMHLEKPGLYKESYILINSYNIISDYAYLAFKKKVFLEGSEAKHLLPNWLDTMIENDHPVARTILQKYCYLLIKLQKISKLDSWFLGGLTIHKVITFQGELGDVSHRCVMLFNKSKMAQLCLEDCIETYRILKERFEDKPQIEFSLYTSIKSRVSRILELMKDQEIDDKKIKDKLETILSSFKSLDNHK